MGKGKVGQKYAGQVIPLRLYNFRAMGEKTSIRETERRNRLN